MPDAVMKHLGGKWYWAANKRFIFPGLYRGTKRLIAIPRLTGAPNVIPFPEQTIVIAEDQPEYSPLPAHQWRDRERKITCLWHLSLRDRFKILFTGRLWHSILTFNAPLQPQEIAADKPVFRR